MILSLKEFRFDSTDIDLLGKKVSSPSSTSFTSMHATDMATIIGGLGNSFSTGKGVAPSLWLSSTSFLNIFPEPVEYYENAGISVQNHSYGIGIENFYGAEARAYDSLVYELPYLVHNFSAGNIGDSTSVEGPYANMPGFANLTGTFKHAKNVLTLGAIDQNLQLESQSSRGPAYDGRIKPELVALGEDGSSGAAAITSGLSILLQQAFAEKNEGSLPSAALIRSTLISTADDLLTPGPDYQSGYGNVNARKAMELIQSGQYWEQTIAGGDTLSYNLTIPENTEMLSITLAWTDPPAENLAPKSLINDLDLWVETENEIIRPLVLNPFPHIDSLLLPALPGIDSLNIQEQVVISAPFPEEFSIKISNAGKQQDFAISYWSEKEDTFTFTYPAKEEILPAKAEVNIHWDAAKNLTTGQLYFKYTHDNAWTEINSEVNINNGFFTWNTPQQPGALQLQMLSPDTSYQSDTFYISPIPEVRLGFDCGEELLLQWNNHESIDNYLVYQLKDDKMEAIGQTSDTVFIVRESGQTQPVFAVAPVLPSGKIGQRSLAINSDFQNQSCYVDNFGARLVGASGIIQFSLTSTYNVIAVQLQKWNGIEFVPLVDWPVNSNAQNYIDSDIETGNNFYQVVITLINDKVIFTNTANVFYVPINEVLIYPNPLTAGQLLQISLPAFQGRRIFIYDALGRLITEDDLLSDYEILETNNWSAGFYFYTIINADQVIEQKGKLVVR